MKRAINFRSFIYSAVMLILSIISCLLALNVAWLGFIILVSIIFIPVIVGILARKRIKTYVFVTLLLTSLLCFISDTIFFVNSFTLQEGELKSDTYQVCGTIDDNYNIDGKRRVILKDISISGDEYDGRFMVTVTGDDLDAASGDVISFRSYVFSRELIDGFEVDGASLRSDIRYYATVNSDHITVFKGEPDLLSKINSYINDKLIFYMGEKYGVIAYGILTGDKNEISSSIRDSFSAAGIAHILAVSGLHIGFLIGVVTFLLRKLKVKRLTTFVISTVVAMLYSALAGFSPSVIRTCIMFLVGGGAMLLGEEQDGLNSLGLAATVILTFSPLLLFEAGFVMSVSAVFGLIIFTPIFTRAIIKIKVPQKVADVVAVPLAAQLGIIPATIYFFGSLQLYSVIANIVLMPLMSMAFIAIFVSLILSILFPLGFLLTLSSYLTRGLTVAADFFSGLPMAVIDVYSSFVVFMLYPIYFLMSGFINVKHKRIVAISCCTLIAMILVVLMTLV